MKRAFLISLALLRVFSTGQQLWAQERSGESRATAVRALEGAGKSVAEINQGGTGALDSSLIELQIVRSREGSKEPRDWLDRELSRGLSAIDPVWGGAYSSIEEPGVRPPIIEKSLRAQAEYVRAYTQAAFAFGNPRYRDVATRIAEFSLQNLSSQAGGFYGAQRVIVGKGLSVPEYLILLDVQRRDIATPTLLTDMPIIENARMIQALSELYASTLDERFLIASKRALAWLESTAPVPAKKKKLSDAELAEQSSVAAAELEVYAVTADKKMLNSAVERISQVAACVVGQGRAALRLGDRAQVARELNLSYRYSGRSELLKASEDLSREYAHGEASGAREDRNTTELLERELRNSPLRLTVVGEKESPQARLLWRALLSCGVPYKRQEWLDSREGGLMNADESFPTLQRPAAFICARDRCSVALFTEEEVREKINEMFPPL